VEGRPHDESTLARLAKEGDVDAYAALVRSHQSGALRLAYLICGGSSDAEDATQEAFVKAYYALDRFDTSAPFRNWLLRIVANEAKNRRRASGRRQHYELAVDPASGGTALSPEAAVIAWEARRSLADAVTRLPPRLRDVVACRYLLELSEAETAAVLGLPVGTAKSRLSRALDRLRREGFDDEEVNGG
jgi:RNA polymerase sigma-70 factor (ECF subfamily)